MLLWLELLENPLHHKMELPPGYEGWEENIRQVQDRLRRVVSESPTLQAGAELYGDEWIENQVKVHVSITNPPDVSFRSRHFIQYVPFLPDNVMRDHRKIIFYDITEEDPYRGMAMFTGMGLGEHYIGANWEDRAVIVQGPGALPVKDAARDLLDEES